MQVRDPEVVHPVPVVAKRDHGGGRLDQQIEVEQGLRRAGEGLQPHLVEALEDRGLVAVGRAMPDQCTSQQRILCPQRAVGEELVLDPIADPVAAPLDVEERRMQAALEQVVESLIGELRMKATSLPARFAAARRPRDRLQAVAWPRPPR